MNQYLGAELDACYARLYDLTRDELRYTPNGADPKEVHGDDFRRDVSCAERE